jgi:hypothetical protein
MPLSVAERERMVDDYDRACMGGLVDGCRGVVSAIGGSGEPEQVARVARIRGRACQLGETGSCRELLTQTQDPAGLRPLATRICELDDDTCVTAMTRFARVDDAGAVELARVVCDHRSPATCGRVAALVSRPARDELLGGACTRGAGDACDLLGGLASDPVQARALYARGCQLGAAAACNHLGELETH